MIINLSVHKNTMAQRKAKRMRLRMKADTRTILNWGINGYAIVAWDQNGGCNVAYALGDTDPMAMPDKVRNAIIRVQTERGVVGTDD